MNATREGTLSILLALAVVAPSAWSDDFKVRRIESALARNAQDRQFVDQQAQITQALLRGEESTTLPAQRAMPFTARRSFDLLPREELAPTQRARQYQAELDRLEMRSRDLEQQRTKLKQTLSTEVHRRTQDQ